MLLFLPAVLSLLLAQPTASSPTNSSSLPIVHLPYVSQRATYYNATADVYVWKNIRFAAPAARFQKPADPAVEDGVLDGSEIADSSCHQAFPKEYTGLDVDLQMGGEDCLFLDVFVPASVLLNNGTQAKAPVLHWIHGGGYVIGSKDFASYGTPWGLLETAAAAGEPMIYAAANYRLGAFGWLAAPEGEVTPNLGMWDARKGIEWVTEYIGLFGGDKDRFTIMGESGGGGVVTGMLTWFGGEGGVGFQQAIVQSPGYFPELPPAASKSGREFIYNTFRTAANCSTFDCLLSAPSSALYASNALIAVRTIVANDTAYLSSVGPLTDGAVLPDYMPRLLESGRIQPLKSVMVANTRYEGRTYADATDPDALGSLIELVAPNGTAAAKQGIERLWEGSGITNYARAVEFFTDVSFACNARFVADAYAAAATKVFRHIFNVGYAEHGSDVPYTFGSTEEGPHKWQLESVVRYVLSGAPTVEGNEWEGTGATWLNETEIGEARDLWGVGTAEDERCQFFLERKQFE